MLKRTDGVLGIVGKASDASVGGGIFTDRLVAFCAKDFKRRTGGLDIFESKRSVLKVFVGLRCWRKHASSAALGPSKSWQMLYGVHVLSVRGPPSTCASCVTPKES